MAEQPGRFNTRQTRDILERLKTRPKKSLGQNFLVDANIVDKSLRMAELEAGQAVVEVGPGAGTLTEALLEAGSKLWCVERDATLAVALRERLGEHPAFSLLEGDAVQHPRAALPEDATDFRVIANLPYAISTPWLAALLAEGPLPQRMVLMLQKEAADRFTCAPGTRGCGAISAQLAAAYAVGGRHPVSRSCFYPPPKVDSVLLRLDLLAQPYRFSEAGREALRLCFGQRRKQVGGTIRRLGQAGEPWLARLSDWGHPTSARPEEISLEAWLALDTLLRGQAPQKS